MRKPQVLSKKYSAAVLLLLLVFQISCQVRIFAEEISSVKDCYQLPKLREAHEQLSNGAFRSAINFEKWIVQVYDKRI